MVLGGIGWCCVVLGGMFSKISGNHKVFSNNRAQVTLYCTALAHVTLIQWACTLPL